MTITELVRSLLEAVGVLSGFFVLFYVLERWWGGNPNRYRTRHFWNDVAYALFYRGDFYQVLIGASVAGALKPQLEFLQLGIFNGWPLPAAAVAFWITSDFLGYWVHRLQHTVPLLWSFHSVHHAQEQMTFLTSYRIHPVEQLLASLILFVPLLVIGIPPESWLPLVAALTALEFSQHSELPWRFGALYRVLVSPVFHAIHHSTDRRHYDKNFGKILSAWDWIFGTAATDRERPTRFGIDGLRVPESLTAQFVTPFRLIRERFGKSSRPPAALAEPGVVSALLQRSGTTLECAVRGRSMGRTFPDGSRVQVRFDPSPSLAIGEVIAFTAGATLVVHRIVGRGRFGSARSFLLTRGDGAVLLDHPIHVGAVVGSVAQSSTSESWEDVPPYAPGGWRFALGELVRWPVLIALNLHHRLALAMTVTAHSMATIARRVVRLMRF